MSRVLVTGATGLLGRSLIPVLRAAGHQVLGQGRQQQADLQADLCDASQTLALLQEARPEVVINLAALTNVDRCESHPDEAYRANVLAVQHLTRAMQQLGQSGHLVQISTDQVYDGQGAQAEDQVVVRNSYAMSKVAAELAAAAVPSTVLRTNFFGRSAAPGRASFSDWLHGALVQAQPIQVFDDIWFSPLAITTLAACIEQAVRLRPLGTFNLGSRGGLSKADFAFLLAQHLGLPTTAMHRCSAQVMAAQRAARPKDMRMDSSRFEQRLGIALPLLADQIALVAQDYRHG